ncbi:MAG: hypothetical protein Kow00103_05310 [Candidatus Caldatribacteriota bacterium]
MKIIRDNKLCYGCKTCQLACSYHHTRSFWPEKSSILVLRSPLTGKIKWSINQTCDECLNEIEPLCIKYCTYQALKTIK